MPRWVLLLHELPDRSWHYDWLIQPAAGGPDAPLISFRVGVRPDDPSVARFPAERIGDHRPLYLSFEGAVGGRKGAECRVPSAEVEGGGGAGGRGTVRRVAEGHARVLRDDAAFVVVLDNARTWVGRRWSFEGPEYDFILQDGPLSTGHLSTDPGIGHTDDRPSV